jgi:hypothetical protein
VNCSSPPWNKLEIAAFFAAPWFPQKGQFLWPKAIGLTWFYARLLSILTEVFYTFHKKMLVITK